MYPSSKSKDFNFELVDSRLKSLSLTIQKLNISNFVIRNSIVKSISPIEPPQIKKTRRRYSINVTNRSKPIASEEPDMNSYDNPIIISKKILLICIVISLFLGILAVYVRMIVKRIHDMPASSKDESMKDFQRALTYWKL